MSVNVVLNGQTYTIPEPGDTAWGQNLTDYFVAQATGLLQKAGGTFSLTADVNFGATYGLKSKYFTSVTSSAATAGALRLASTDSISWRNNANGADVALAKDTSDNLTWAGNILASSGGLVYGTWSGNPIGATYGGTGIDTHLSSGIPSVSVGTWSISTTTGSGSVVRASSPIITLPTIATLVNVSNVFTIADSADNSKAIKFNASGNTTGKSTTLLSAATNNRTLTYPDVTDTFAGIAATQTLTNKTIDAASNTITNLNNATISATAAIQLSKLENLTSSQIIVGSVANVPTAVSMTGDITISNAGVTSIGASKVLNSMLSGSITASKLVGSDIATVGTVTAGTWNATRIGALYGGTGVDTSASTGVAKVASGTWSVATVVNADISSSAAIAYSKLALTGAILNADLAGSIADSKLSTIATAGKVSDSALPSSMATKTFTGVTTFPSSSSVDASGNAVWGGSAQVGNSLSTGVNAFNGKTTNRTASATNGGTAVTATISTAGYPGMCIVYGTNSGNSAQILFGSSNTLVINAIVGTEFVPSRTSGTQTVVTYNSGTGVLSLQNFSGADQTYGLAKLGF